jgi:hypothetical protein
MGRACTIDEFMNMLRPPPCGVVYVNSRHCRHGMSQCLVDHVTTIACLLHRALQACQLHTHAAARVIPSHTIYTCTAQAPPTFLAQILVLCQQHQVDGTKHGPCAR